ncbi:Extradiol ring-cleavage dioxygenase [Acrodontium crateriforme]|uniref:Extradiol ring-cleavage dioxygenase n=1 Tax=Acrodontium crateriforme TaxID=150365 RepID=A0AAQ3LXK5_9PEZI|nr:Extradiol ring-cleavage dioxygenase [Acrodontium crateriforme]
MPRRSSWLFLLIFGLSIALLPILLDNNETGINLSYTTRASNLFCRATNLFRPVVNQNISTQDIRIGTNASMAVKTPVYFLSHGGPNIMEDKDHPAYAKLQGIGKEITQQKPKGIVVFSAHWQGEPNVIEVNTAETMPLIYDFYGFPDHYYQYQYPHTGSPELAEKVLNLLKGAGIKAEGVRRGLDHGVWASFMCAFDPKENPLGVPIVQVSLFNSDDGDKHYELGRAVRSLREEGIQIIVSGMAVHNLRDLWKAMSLSQPMPYAVSFDEALKEAVEQRVDGRQKAMAELLKRPDARKAHPSFEHLLPIHIGAGAAGDDLGKQLWTKPEGSMSWALYRFGEPVVA